jgi:cupin 2 domain-containing protein
MLANLFTDLPLSSEREEFLQLLSCADAGVKIERIVSRGHASPPGFWYEEPHGEWVTVLAGEARLRFEDESEARSMRPGDFADIAPRRRHRVEATHPSEPTVWLAVHYGVTPLQGPETHAVNQGYSETRPA